MIFSGQRFFRILFLLACLTFIFPSYSSSPAAPIKIAVIDTGVDEGHQLLKDHLFVNAGESGMDSTGQDRATNGIDDDNNGYIDDVHGWNFANNSNKLSDTDGHGTHINGVITQVIMQQKNKIPFQLLNIKYYARNTSSHKRTNAFIDALEYAVNMKADIINISGGGPQFNERELNVLQRAASQGILIVASAGNKKTNSSDKIFYPAGYELPNIISVIATDHWGKVLPTSNVNANKSNIYAVGDQMRSSLPSNRYGKKTGSSQAAAVLTGYLAKYISERKLFNVAELRSDFSLSNSQSQTALFVSNSPN